MVGKPAPRIPTSILYPPTMNRDSGIDQYLVYNPHYRTIICRQHGYAIAPGGMIRHLRDYHKIPLKTRQALNTYSESLDLCAVDELQIPSEPVDSINGLTIVDGSQCNLCMEKGASSSIKKHCRIAHQWGEGKVPIWTKQRLQTFFPGTNCKCGSR